MERGSIDGRSRKKPVASRSASASVPKQLRPASPPRVNPWNRTPSSAIASDDFPALPSAKSPVLESQVLPVEVSRTSSVSTYPQSPDVEVLQPTPMTPSASTCSDSSRHIFEAAAPRATENLWLRPFGFDVVVQTTTMSFRLHRNIVESQSSWFRDNLPPPNPQGLPVTVPMNCPGEGVAHCFRFMYTGRTEIFEFDETRPWNLIHLPRCVLGYNAAVFLRMSKMSAHLLRIVERTAVRLETLVTSKCPPRQLEYTEWMEFSWNYQNALWILHNLSPRILMMPMRLAMASVLDGILFWMLGQLPFLGVLQTWKHVIDTLLLDQAEYRRLLREANPSANSPVACEATLKRLFENEQDNIQVNQAVEQDVPAEVPFAESGLELREQSDSLSHRRCSM